MRKILFICLSFIICNLAIAQPSEVTLVVTGEGATKEEATNNALRSAVEQAFGVFVSANTEILNDEIVKDEIASISSGNIKSFVENAYIERPDGLKIITLSATVSLSQLVSYTKNHGYSTEFAGSTFGANMRLYELNRKATALAQKNFYRELSFMLPSMYDYHLAVKDPVIDGDKCYVEITVNVLANENTKRIGDYYFSTIRAMSHTGKEVEALSEMGNHFYAYYFNSFPNTKKLEKKGASSNLVFVKQGNKSLEPVYLYEPLNHGLINHLFRSAILGYEICIQSNEGSCPVSSALRSQTDKVAPYDFEVRKDEQSIGFDRNKRKGFMTGVYSPVPNPIDGYRVVPLDKNVPLVNNSQLTGIVTRNTEDYKSGEIMYQTQWILYLDKESMYKISSFTIEPNFSSGVASVITGLNKESFDLILNDLNYRKAERLSLAESLQRTADELLPIVTAGSDYHIGKYVDKEGGIVYWVSPDNKEVKLLSLAEYNNCEWERAEQWSKEYGDGTWGMPTVSDLQILSLVARYLNNHALVVDHQPLAIRKGNEYWTRIVGDDNAGAYAVCLQNCFIEYHNKKYHCPTRLVKTIIISDE